MLMNAHPTNTRPRRRWQARVLAAMALLTAAVASPPAFACGYENPNDLALGLLNWVLPNSLYVQTAVWQAEKSGILPPRPAKPAKDLFGGGFRRAAASLNALGDRLNTVARASGERTSFSVVLIPAVMWTRFAPTATGYSIAVHADGPATGDLVIVTDERVVRALADGLLDIATAENYGLVRFYGPTDRQNQARETLAGLPAARSSPRISPISYNPG